MSLKKICQIIGLSLLLFCFTSCEKNDISDELTLTSGVKASELEANKVEVFGIVDAKETKDIFIDFDARINDVHVKNEQVVKKGDVLMTLNMVEYKTNLEKMARQIETKKLELEKQRNQILGSYTDIKRLKKELANKRSRLSNGNDSDILKLQSQLETFKEVLKVTKNDLDRVTEFYSDARATKVEYEKAKKQYDLDKNNVDTIYHELGSLKIVKEEEIDRINAELDSKLASVDNSLSIEDNNNLKIMEQTIENLEGDYKIAKDRITKDYIDGNDIISDIESGVIHNIGYNQGAIANKQVKALSISSLDSLYIVAEVPEEFIKDVRTGMKAIVIPQTDTSKKYTGIVSKIRNMTISKSGETDIRVEISLDKKDELLVLNSNVEIEILTE